MDRQNRALSVRKGQSPFPRPSAPPAPPAAQQPRAPPTPPQDYSDDDNAARGQYRNNFNKSSSRYTSGRQEPVASAFPSYYFSNDGATANTTKPRSQQQPQQQQQRPPTPPKEAPQTRTSPKMPQGPFQGTRRRQPSEPQPQSRPRAGSQRQQQQQQQYSYNDADYQNTSSSRVRDYSNVSINIGTGGFGFGGSGGPSITVNGRDWRDEGGRSRDYHRYRDDRANGDRYWDDGRDDGRPRINHIHTPFISTPFGFGGDRPWAGFLNLGGFGIF
ncbi:hypothetical protein PgNI_11038 [Pyricularia grisea]|uniref:Uncharacterized protein n=1 Tax=Pyricularia grisea TaxID=148305 RepID=A0A6P8AY25_PYRGI|nr:hypothetical protein PgNI_11038 [Pyricularia grisea]TLD07186.1 hypothetical protein PgNI_11038 [Pyricularia grisea]